jgi:hypothetical protein
MTSIIKLLHACHTLGILGHHYSLQQFDDACHTIGILGHHYSSIIKLLQTVVMAQDT